MYKLNLNPLIKCGSEKLLNYCRFCSRAQTRDKSSSFLRRSFESFVSNLVSSFLSLSMKSLAFSKMVILGVCSVKSGTSSLSPLNMFLKTSLLFRSRSLCLRLCCFLNPPLGLMLCCFCRIGFSMVTTSIFSSVK